MNRLTAECYPKIVTYIIENIYEFSYNKKGGYFIRLKDKVAIIIGGCCGIRFAAADKFLSEGAKVVTAVAEGAVAVHYAEEYLAGKL